MLKSIVEYILESRGQAISKRSWNRPGGDELYAKKHQRPYKAETLKQDKVGNLLVNILNTIVSDDFCSNLDKMGIKLRITSNIENSQMFYVYDNQFNSLDLDYNKSGKIKINGSKNYIQSKYPEETFEYNNYNSTGNYIYIEYDNDSVCKLAKSEVVKKPDFIIELYTGTYADDVSKALIKNLNRSNDSKSYKLITVGYNTPMSDIEKEFNKIKKVYDKLNK